MRFLTILIFYIILHVDSSFEKLCSRRVPVHKTRRVLRSAIRVGTKRNWIGLIKTELQSYTYFDTEYYLAYDVEYECCFGYTKKDNECEPTCPSGCALNAYCVQPFQCACKAGYFWSLYNPIDKAFCAPRCENGCPTHSKCTAPNSCVCDTGYKWDSKTGKCQPTCATECPMNTYCAEPNTCQCRDGYELKAFSSGNITCEPICKTGCQIWAQCVAPDTCACVAGYEMINGHCVCDSGYEFHLADKKCKPVCSLGCPAYSYCVQPETCACDAGYTINENRTQCLPVCEGGCPMHSVCYKPGECLCDEGFRPKQLADDKRTMECEAICPENCEPYGRCNDTGACVCHPGYVFDNDASGPESLCKPHCSQGCKNGICFGPETCVCNAGFLMGPNSTCMPTCSLSCQNAECIEPEICACLPGHSFKNGSVSVCEPICEPPCVNGDCVAPDLCLCKDHFEPILEQKNHCTPSCVPECQDGVCVGPQQCACWQGFELRSADSHECLPVCTDCEFGECTSPEVCTCHAGFYEERNENGTTCLPLETTTETIIYTASTSDAELDFELPGAACSAHCKCWQIADHEISLQKASCESFCNDAVDKTCVNPDDCMCTVDNLRLNCYTNANANGTKTYRCLMPFNVPPSNATASEQLNLSHIKRASFPWVVTLCSILSAFLILTLLLVVWRFYNNKHRAGHYAVGSEDLIIDYQN